MTALLTLKRLDQACREDAAVRRVARLQPAGGIGDKVFPPTYEGGEYALEDRVIDGKRVPCALLDSVQSQANRIEQGLLDAQRDGRITLPVVTVDFTGDLPEVGLVTSLDAPHRLADAILRDSVLDGVSFRETEVGRVLDTAAYTNATGLFGVCPTALVLGIWDSAGPRGGLGTKFARGLVAEIIGVDVEIGRRPSSRVDPLGIQLTAGPIFEAKDGWTTDPEFATKEKGKPKRVGKEGKPSEINHGNVTPSLKSDNGVYHHGGVTCSYAQQTSVLSLPALRRLRFPDGDGVLDTTRDAAARLVLAALSLTGVVLSASLGTDLRSRCLLVPDSEVPPRLEIVTASGIAEAVALGVKEAFELLRTAVGRAKEAGLPWHDEGIRLRPKAQLVELVRRSRAKAIEAGAEN
jgi:CRISPR-associated protein Csb1